MRALLLALVLTACGEEPPPAPIETPDASVQDSGCDTQYLDMVGDGICEDVDAGVVGHGVFDGTMCCGKVAPPFAWETWAFRFCVAGAHCCVLPDGGLPDQAWGDGGVLLYDGGETPCCSNDQHCTVNGCQ